MLGALRARGVVVGKAEIISARVPIIKCRLAGGGGGGGRTVPVDISLGVANGVPADLNCEMSPTPSFAYEYTWQAGCYPMCKYMLVLCCCGSWLMVSLVTADWSFVPSSLCVVAYEKCWRAGAAAVTYMAQQTAAVPALRPLVLVVKALLKQWNLNQVFRGGLSSYAAALLMLAHLQTLNPTQTLSGLGLPVAGARAGVDLGHALLGFLERFGQQFDYEREAVSVRQGGVVPKPRAWRLKNKPRLLAVEDPQVAGKILFCVLSCCAHAR